MSKVVVLETSRLTSFWSAVQRCYFQHYLASLRKFLQNIFFKIKVHFCMDKFFPLKLYDPL